ncbi:hypothetical protein B0H10DRAFT_1952055 [Mycena sp. CBHHK59/15]|nr:hypothetical protein B0H10DRAFT_1952055 [Mycena sp. CBHHK59/15]
MLCSIHNVHVKITVLELNSIGRINHSGIWFCIDNQNRGHSRGLAEQSDCGWEHYNEPCWTGSKLCSTAGHIENVELEDLIQGLVDGAEGWCMAADYEKGAKWVWRYSEHWWLRCSQLTGFLTLLPFKCSLGSITPHKASAGRIFLVIVVGALDMN